MRKADSDLQLSIDGQCDSPGHNATYCTVSAMDVSTSKILDYKIIDVKEKNWIKPGSPVHHMLIKILSQAQLVKYMHKLNENISTAGLEVFHSLKIRYLPKSIFFEKDKMLASTALAIMDHNLNVDRKQVKKTFSPRV